MPFNKHIIPRRPRDPGSVQQGVDLQRRLQKVEGTYGVIGAGATITAPIVETDEPGVPRMYMQGSLNGAVPGLFLVDASDNAIFSITNAGVYVWKGDGTLSHYLSLTPGSGLSLVESNNPAFGINWEGGAYIRAYNSGYVDFDFNYVHHCAINIKATNIGGFTSHIQIFDNGHTATLLDGAGNTAFPGTVTGSNLPPSDIELKENIEQGVGDKHRLIHKLQPIKFKYKSREGIYYGFIAQEIQKVLPEITREVIMPAPQMNQEPLAPDETPEQPDHKKLLAYSSDSLMALLVATVQEQEQRIKQLEDHNGGS